MKQGLNLDTNITLNALHWLLAIFEFESIYELETDAGTYLTQFQFWTDYLGLFKPVDPHKHKMM